jgi:hypothetical protein
MKATEDPALRGRLNFDEHRRYQDAVLQTSLRISQNVYDLDVHSRSPAISERGSEVVHGGSRVSCVSRYVES